MVKISLCLIVKNEERNIGGFLENVKKHVDEVIVVDTGSADGTVKIASKFADKIYSFEWKDDFSLARNFSVSKASGDWILVLDPDEVISKDDLAKIRKLVSSAESGVFGFRLVQESYFDGNVIGARGICRLFRNDKRIRFVYPVHESVREFIKKLGCKIGKTGIVIKHHPKISKEKKEYYLRLLKVKKEKFPESNWKKEIELEKKGGK